MATIAEEITALSGRIQEAYDVCEAKGATMPQSKTTWNLSSTIDSIPAGGGTFLGMDLSGWIGQAPADLSARFTYDNCKDSIKLNHFGGVPDVTGVTTS